MKYLKYILLIPLFFLGCSQIEFVNETVNPLTNQPALNFSQTINQQAVEKIIDILVVVDNSPSMEKDQKKLSKGFESFVSSISNANYRIGVITTDTDSEDEEDTQGYHGNLALVEATGKKFIEKSDNNPSQLFSDLIRRDETTDCGSFWGQPCASFDERPLYAIKMAIDKRNTVNTGFFREGADIGIVIITDEDETDFSDGTYYSAENLLSHFENEFQGSKEISAFTIAIPEGDSACHETQSNQENGGSAVAYGIRVGELSTLTGGFFVNICDENFSSSLSLISNYMKKNLLPLKIKVPKTIIINSIDLLVTDPNGNIFKTNYSIKNNIFKISPVPPEGSKIKLTYKF